MSEGRTCRQPGLTERPYVILRAPSRSRLERVDALVFELRGGKMHIASGWQAADRGGSAHPPNRRLMRHGRTPSVMHHYFVGGSFRRRSVSSVSSSTLGVPRPLSRWAV